MNNRSLHRNRRIVAGTVVGVSLALGLFISGSLPGSIIPARAQQPAGGPELESFVQTLPNSVVKVRMVAVPGGTLTIRGKQITVKPFWIARTETPWEAFDAYTASGEPSKAYDQTEFTADAVARPSHSYILPDLGWGHNGYPAINLTYLTSDMFCRWVAAGTGKKYRLPTEAEWEWACRTGSAGPWKIDKAQLEKSAWYIGNSDGMSHPVGKKSPNKWGLNDMLGNAGEWATDVDGKPILCGGTFMDNVKAINPTTRRRQTPKWQETDPQFPKSRWWLADGKFVGFRLVCEP